MTARTDLSSILIAIGAALAVGVAGAAAWGVVEVQTGYEIGIAAAGIGWIVGTAVLRATGGHGPPYQAVAIAVSLGAIVLGKYIAFVYAVKDVARSVGVDPGRITLWSSDVAHSFFAARGSVFGGFDLLWAGFAVVAAYRILQPPAAPLSTPPTERAGPGV